MIFALKLWPYSTGSQLKTDVAEVLEFAQGEFGKEGKIAVLGFCFGGWLVARVCSDPDLKKSLSVNLACGIGCHLSWIVENIFHWGRDTDIAKEIF